MRPRRLAVLIAISLIVPLPLAADGEELAPAPTTKAPTFLGFYLWEQAIFQYLPDGAGGFTVERGDQLGGRLVGGLGLGRLGFELRADVTGLKDEFDAQDPETYTTLEVYGGAHFVAMERHGVQIGPVAAAGSVANEQSAAGIGLDFWGGGVRLAGRGAEFHVTVGRHDYLALGGWRLSLSGHIPVVDRIYAVGDLVSGADGFVRVGIAVRVK